MIYKEHCPKSETHQNDSKRKNFKLDWRVFLLTARPKTTVYFVRKIKLVTQRLASIGARRVLSLQFVERNAIEFLLGQVLILGLTSLLNFCIYPIREAEALENDISFLYLNSAEFSQAELEKVTSIWKVRQLKGKGISAEDKNNLGIIFAKNSFLDDAESAWRECLKISEFHPVCFSNLIRMHYLIDEYEIAKKEIATYLKNAKKDQIQQVRKILTTQNRREETVLLLDVQSKIPGMEVVSWDELSTYFLEKQDYEKAYFYLEKILQIDPYHKNARASMVLLAHDLEKWDDLLMFAMNLHSTDDKIPDLNYYIAKAYYEKRNYSEALEWIRKSPESERETLSFVELWKRILLSLNPTSDLHPILPYIKKMQSKGLQIREEDILPTLSSSGKKTMEDIKVGR
ncbi:tetratricopeptide repeat protein [Leptospira alexanderi serovar Manhao 3 str. L 60]|uniref:Tetratricopeptide repeat protein n=1 Tax=Leptospira alexanderi serovar Manhao 3 str. L 60 TaxID=1049759 RepID=V6I461_9LEPT|nr:tetratricopeptide repeat protein [Leptospira alexanderi serovar Manhao 3 str. L 60]